MSLRTERVAVHEALAPLLSNYNNSVETAGLDGVNVEVIHSPNVLVLSTKLDDVSVRTIKDNATDRVWVQRVEGPEYASGPLRTWHEELDGWPSGRGWAKTVAAGMLSAHLKLAKTAAASVTAAVTLERANRISADAAFERAKVILADVEQASLIHCIGQVANATVAAVTANGNRASFRIVSGWVSTWVEVAPDYSTGSLRVTNGRLPLEPMGEVIAVVRTFNLVKTRLLAGEDE
jgi:hypothetical protein